MLRLIRRFGTTWAPRASKGLLEVPDNAPSLNDNITWLGKMSPSETADKLDLTPEKTYVTVDRSDCESKAHNPSLVTFMVSKGKQHTVIRQPNMSPDDYHPYHTVSVPVKAYDVSSSPFSTLPSNRRPKSDSAQAFSDLKVVKLKAGAGGTGEVSFRRDSGLAIGPPDGGDGGAGGDIYIMAVEGMHSLHNVKSKYAAKDGARGSSGQLDGKKGESVVLTVPVGTTIRWCPSPKEIRSLQREDHENKVFHIECVGKGKYPDAIQFFRPSYPVGKGWTFKEKDEEYHLSREYFTELRDKVKAYDRECKEDELNRDTFPLDGMDFSEPTSEPVLLLGGGKGGLGNMHFLTTNIRNPRFAKVGRGGLEQDFIFELKLLADLGLVGLPNAGKSTLLRAISRARPKVGNWKFTTLQPSIGTTQLRIDQEPFTVADIPGIVQGAKDNKGMGLSFLRHIERSGGIIFVVSLGGKDPVADLKVLEGELGADRLKDKNKLVVATKADLDNTQDKFYALRSYCDSKGWKCVPCSPKQGGNIETVVELMAECSGRSN